MAKGGGEKSYFVGTIKKTEEPSRSLAGYSGKPNTAINYVTKAAEEEEEVDRTVENSPSVESRKVHFLEVENEKEESPNSQERNVSVSSTGNTSAVKGILLPKDSNSSTNSRTPANDSTHRPVQGDTRTSKIDSTTNCVEVSPRTSEVSNKVSSYKAKDVSETSSQKATSQKTKIGNQVTESRSTFKFRSRPDIAPDSFSLISQSPKGTGNSEPSSTPVHRSDDFRFHAGYEDDFEKSEEDKSKAKKGSPMKG